jgi:sensor histidine kinase regulating citrate/malate metabolism
MKVKTAALIAAGIALLESLLIIWGGVHPLADYSADNLLFTLLIYLVLGHCAAGFAGNFRKAALAGAEIALSANIVYALAIFAGNAVGVPVLGVSVPDMFSLALVILVSLILNTLLGAGVGAAVAWVAGKVRAKEGKKH